MLIENKKCIGIIFGGESNEHEISISSAKTVFQAFNSEENKNKFIVKAFYIDKKGFWSDNEQSRNLLEDKNINGIFKKEEIKNQEKINFLENINFNCIDIWFPLLHGSNGEDGAIQGLLKFTHKPLVGGGILGSAIGMDKILMKKLFTQIGIPQVNYLAIQNQDLNNEHIRNKLLNEIINKFNFPIFVKPSNSGSSLGISKVKNKSEIIKALMKAWEVDSRILIEEGLEIRELECGIIGNSQLSTSEIGEVLYSREWYDYDSKYSMENKVMIPADIDPNITKQIKEIALKSCRALNIFGFARADFFLDKNSNKIFINEINTIPGFTNKSMFPMLWKASGLNIDQLVAKLVNISLGS